MSAAAADPNDADPRPNGPDRPADPAPVGQPVAGPLRIVLRGRLVVAPHPAGDPDAAYVHGLAAATDAACPEPAESLAGQVQRLLAGRPPATGVRYAVGDRGARPGDNFTAVGATWRGAVRAAAGVREGVIPGRWVVADEVRVGDADLLAALRPHAGQLCHLEILFAPTRDAA